MSNQDEKFGEIAYDILVTALLLETIVALLLGDLLLARMVIYGHL